MPVKPLWTGLAVAAVLALSACTEDTGPVAAPSGGGGFSFQSEVVKTTRYCLNALHRRSRSGPRFDEDGYFRRPNGGYIKQLDTPVVSGAAPPKIIVHYVPRTAQAPANSCAVAIEGANRASSYKGVTKAEGDIFDTAVVGALSLGFVPVNVTDDDGDTLTFLVKNNNRILILSRVTVEGRARTMIQTFIDVPD